MTGQILVTPENLTLAADELNTASTTVKSLTTQMMDEITGLSSVWKGDASSAYLTKFSSLQDDMEKVYNKIQEHVTDLKEMARIYTDAETANQEAAQALAGDVLE